MSCYNPLMAKYGPINEDTGKNKVQIIGPFDGKDEKSFKLLDNGNIFLIPCGKCQGCKLDYARHWADRMVLEYEVTKKGMFVTLTYEDRWLPNVNPLTGHIYNIKTDLNEWNGPISPLVITDLQEFIKSLRSKFSDSGSGNKFRFFACGEYGADDNGKGKHRPHFHIILFGVDMSDVQVPFSTKPGDTSKVVGDLEEWHMNELGQMSYRSNFLECVWKERGIVTVSDVSYNTMAYVARYSLKKSRGDDYAARYNLPKEFTNMSRNPGIGAPFLIEHQKAVESVSSWFVNGKKIYWPSYLVSKYIDIDEQGNIKYYDRGEDDPFLQKTKDMRKNISLNRFLNNYEKYGDHFLERMAFENNETTERVKSLKRGDVTLR